MTDNGQGKDERKAAMKRLRAERRETIAAASARAGQQKRDIKAITEALAGGGATVPQVAEATGMGTEEVFWYLAALKKYGRVAEGEKDGAYFRYAIVGGSPDETSDAGEA